MKLLQKIGALIVLVSVVSTAQAEMKIAVVDFRQALMATDVAKALRKEVQVTIDSSKKDAESLISELKKLEEQYKKDGPIMSDEEKKKLVGQMQKKQGELRAYEQNVQKKIQGMEQAFMKQHGPTAEKVARELMDAKGYDMVLNPTAVVHALPKHDLTKELKEKLNTALKK